jgi:hypothetical protein
MEARNLLSVTDQRASQEWITTARMGAAVSRLSGFLCPARRRAKRNIYEAVCSGHGKALGYLHTAIALA